MTWCKVVEGTIIITPHTAHGDARWKVTWLVRNKHDGSSFASKKCYTKQQAEILKAKLMLRAE